jgi:hypothetical protein
MKLLPLAHFVAFASLAVLPAPAPAAEPPRPPGTAADPTEPPTPINFTVQHLVETPSEGPDLPRPCFSVGKRRISFHEPAKCPVSSEANELSFVLSNRGILGQVSVTNSSLQPDIKFDTDLDRYFQDAGKSVPTDATDVKFEGAKPDLFKVNGWSSLSFEWTYAAFGRATKRQVSYINIDPQHQVRLTTVSVADQWKEANGIAVSFMRSWYVVPSTATLVRGK